ncbi:hypothetical protein [Nocardiopsis valliformis]|uniref:hypothetical protein n=1 Tax=Nocardiopsis valliformis TaxID=239974 RepID=UPI00037B1BA0|nr:hypothetical protein [Nocardiopsis valliformis]
MGIDLRLYLAFLTASLVGIGSGLLWYMGGDNPYHAVIKGVFAGGAAFTAVFFLLGGGARHDCDHDSAQQGCREDVD